MDATTEALGEAAGSIVVTRDGDVATVELHRPERRNAISYTMWLAFARLMPVLAADDGVGVLVVRGTPGGPFSAGADISEFGALRSAADSAAAYGDAVSAGERALVEFPKPTLALVQGWAVGGGAQLAVACDLRVCDTGSQYGVTPARLGIVYGAASTARLVDVVGSAWAGFFLLTGELVDAATALRIGLVHEVCEPAAVEARAYALAAVLADRARVSQVGGKRLIARTLAGRRDEDDEVRERYRRSLTGPEYAEGVAAFLAKRAPDFRGVRNRA